MSVCGGACAEKVAEEGLHIFHEAQGKILHIDACDMGEGTLASQRLFSQNGKSADVTKRFGGTEKITHIYIHTCTHTCTHPDHSPKPKQAWPYRF